MKKTWEIMLVIAIGFVLGIIIFLSTHHKLGNSSPALNSTNNMDKSISIEVLKEGNGPEIKNGETAVVHYVGTLVNGTQFDSSRSRGTPFSFVLGAGRVIKGWEVGILGMKVGEIRKLTIQPEYGYGSSGAGEIIPPNAVLIFEVELLGIN